MTITRAAIITVLFAFSWTWQFASAQDKPDKIDEAWNILRTGVNDKETGKREQAVRVLGLLRGQPEGVKLAQAALSDEKAEVRAVAATALGQMGSRASIPRLEGLLSDKEPSVVLAAANALTKFHDQSAYDVFYEVLTGERKTGKGLIAGEKETLKDPKKLAEIGFTEGIGFVPFAGIGVSAFKALRTDDVSPVRAAAAKLLADDKDPQSGDALVQAAFDKSWVVRAAALESIATRGDALLRERILPALADSNYSVRCTAAAAAIRLSTIPSAPSHKPQ